VLVRESRVEMMPLESTVKSSETEISEGTVSHNMLTKQRHLSGHLTEDNPLSVSMLNMFINYRESVVVSPGKKEDDSSGVGNSDEE